MRRAIAAFVVVLAAAAPALAGPGGKSNYVNLRGEALSFHPDLLTDTGVMRSPTAPAGASLEWGSFQNKFVAAGTRIGFTLADPAWGKALMFGGGPQFHFLIEDRIVIIPAFNLAYRLSDLGFGLGVYFSLAAGVRLNETFYLAIEGEQPLYLQGFPGSAFMPAARTANVLLGIYY